MIQPTHPAPIREIFNLKKGSTVIFKVTDKGVFFMPCEIKEKESYTREEWTKIERMDALEFIFPPHQIVLDIVRRTTHYNW